MWRSLTFDRSDYAETITVLVGPDEVSFTAHKEQICARATFFRAACSKHWREGQERVVRLPAHEPDVFLAYLHWMYTGKLDMTLIEEPLILLNPPSYLNLGKVWSFGSYIGDNRFCNTVVDLALERFDALPGRPVKPLTLQQVWTMVHPDSAIRRLFKDMCIARYSDPYFDKHYEELPLDIVREMARRFASGEVKEGSGPTSVDRCNYHVHEGGAAKCV